MARIHEEILIDAQPAQVWAALRDWGALHEKLVPGFVIDTQLDGDDRIVTFGNGTVVRARVPSRQMLSVGATVRVKPRGQAPVVYPR